MKTKIVFLGALLFAGTTVASNQDNPWYAGARIGATHYSDFENNLFSNDALDNDNLGAGLFLGYNINDWFALETGYTYLGKIKISDQAEIENQAIEVVGKFTWQATQSLDLFAKAGGFIYQTAGKEQLSGLKERDADGTLGLGVEHHFTDNFSARVEYQFYHNMTLNDELYRSEWDTHLVSLGLIYSWGGADNIKVVDAPVAPVAEAVEEKPVAQAPEQTKEIVAEEVKQPVTVEPVTAQVYFDTKSNALSAQSIEQLQPIIKHLNNHPSATLFLVGHTDSRGSKESNQILSEQRAKALSDYLTKEFSIAQERITYSGEGESVPIASNKTKQGQAQNRRVSVFSPSFVVTK